MQLLVILGRLQPERVEIGMQVAAHTVSADHHQSADAVASGALHIFGRNLRSRRLRLGGNLLADRLLDLDPVAIERGDELAVRMLRPVRFLPGCATRTLAHGRRIVLQRAEEFLPLRIDAGGILLITSVKVFDPGGVGAVEEGGLQKAFVLFLTRHAFTLGGITPAAAHRRCEPSSQMTAQCGLSMARSAFQHVGKRFAEPRRRRRNTNACGFHSGDLVFSAALAAGNDCAGMTHAAARRRRTAGDKAGPSASCDHAWLRRSGIAQRLPPPSHRFHRS